MARTDDARALAKLAGAAQRAYPGVAGLYRMHTDESLPIELRRGIVAVIEALDLLRFHIREATLNDVIRGPRRVPVKRVVVKKRAKR
jgi:hypothetical protein